MKIDEISMVNFKCFKNDSFAMAPLTLLTGNNATGKSSLLQAILVARYSVTTEFQFVPLNDLFGLQLGHAVDVRSYDATGEEVEIDIRDETGEYHWAYSSEGDPYDSLLLEIISEPARRGGEHVFADRFTYLNAERLGPRETFELSSAPIRSQTVGSRGEYVAQVIANQERRQVREENRFPAATRGKQRRPATTLLKQCEAWLSEFIGDAEIRAEINSATNRAYLRFKSGEGDSATIHEWTRPSNTGFGLTYCLPILVAGLLGASGELMLVENPEAHLHPRAQSKMGQFLGRLAAGGMQVVVESHSDHILNGIRLATVEEEHPLGSEDVLIHFFAGDNVEKVTVDERGGLSQWPQFFFDQSQRDLREIVEKRK